MEGPSKICTELRSPRVNANLDPLLAIEDEDVLEGGAFGGSDNEEEDVARAERGNQLVNKETGYGAAEAMLAKQLLLVQTQKRALDRVLAWSTSDKNENGGGETFLGGIDGNGGDDEAANDPNLKSSQMLVRLPSRLLIGLRKPKEAKRLLM